MTTSVILGRASIPDSGGGRAAPPPFAARPVLAVAGLVAAVLTALSGRYGFHRDELYFMVAGDHPAFGYVDQPPLTPLIARASTAVFGDSPAGLRVAATLGFAAIVIITALVARELGGGRRAQSLAAGCTAVAGFTLAVGHMVSTATFDLLAWLLISWLALRLLRTGDGRWWLPLGAAVGLAMQNKYLVVLLVAALLPAVLVTGPRQVLRSRWAIAGVAIAMLVALPNLWWQATHGWPQLTVAGGISGDDGVENRLMFLPQQLILLSPVLVPIWIAGWRRLWRDPGLRWARAMAPAYPLLGALVFVSGGKPYYALAPQVVLLAAGCEPLARWTREGRRSARAWTVVTVLAFSAVADAVVSLPVLPPKALSAITPVNPELGEQVGWPALVGAVRDGWAAIPADQRGRAVIFTQNYGQAGAIAQYGPRYDLPTPYSGHMGFADWGPPPESANGPVLVVHQQDARGIERHFTDCRRLGQVDNRQNVDNEEQGTAITLCSGTTAPWPTLWPSLRHFY